METGRTDGLDGDGDSSNSLHSFAGPPVPQGEGASISRAFLDGNHTLISIMARINPSPDWFVGVDSFQLCVEGNWVDTVTVEVNAIHVKNHLFIRFVTTYLLSSRLGRVRSSIDLQLEKMSVPGMAERTFEFIHGQ